MNERILTAADISPADADAQLIGRGWSNDMGGPCAVLVPEGVVYDLSSIGPTMTGLLKLEDLHFRTPRAFRGPI